MKVVLVHDYLREYGGAERVIEVFHEMYPEAPLYTAFVDWETMGEFGERFKNWDLRTTWVNRNWVVKRFHSPLRFLAPIIWESLDLRDFDVVISSSGWYMCRGVITSIEQLHISYIHHPPRNLYGFPTGSQSNSLIRAYAGIINPFLRAYDFAAAQRPDYLVANSETTRERIRKFYRREAKVIYPPIDIQKSKIKNQNDNSKFKNEKKYYLSVGRLNFAKRVDLAVKACNQLKLPLKIVGAGKEEENLRANSGPTIEFLGSVTDEKLNKLYSGAKALIFSALEEDFGMVPVEAMAHGVPIIALKQGGVVETVIEGKTGIFFGEPTVESLVKAIEKFDQDFNNNNFFSACQQQAQKFAKADFKLKMQEFVEEKYSVLKETISKRL